MCYVGKGDKAAEHVLGVTPILLEEKNKVFELFDYATEACLQRGLVHKGDVVVFTSGVPIGISGTTNMIKAQIIA